MSNLASFGPLRIAAAWSGPNFRRVQVHPQRDEPRDDRRPPFENGHEQQRAPLLVDEGEIARLHPRECGAVVSPDGVE
jgi:hypothetical protein